MTFRQFHDSDLPDLISRDLDDCEEDVDYGHHLELTGPCDTNPTLNEPISLSPLPLPSTQDPLTLDDFPRTWRRDKKIWIRGACSCASEFCSLVKGLKRRKVNKWLQSFDQDARFFLYSSSHFRQGVCVMRTLSLMDTRRMVKARNSYLIK